MVLREACKILESLGSDNFCLLQGSFGFLRPKAEKVAGGQKFKTESKLVKSTVFAYCDASLSPFGLLGPLGPRKVGVLDISPTFLTKAFCLEPGLDWKFKT